MPFMLGFLVAVFKSGPIACSRLLAYFIAARTFGPRFCVMSFSALRAERHQITLSLKATSS